MNSGWIKAKDDQCFCGIRFRSWFNMENHSNTTYQGSVTLHKIYVSFHFAQRYNIILCQFNQVLKKDLISFPNL